MGKSASTHIGSLRGLSRPRYGPKWRCGRETRPHLFALKPSYRSRYQMDMPDAVDAFRSTPVVMLDAQQRDLLLEVTHCSLVQWPWSPDTVTDLRFKI